MTANQFTKLARQSLGDLRKRESLQSPAVGGSVGISVDGERRIQVPARKKTEDSTCWSLRVGTNVCARAA